MNNIWIVYEWCMRSANYIFFFLQGINICNFVDDTILFVYDETLESVPDELEDNSERAIFWFENNYIKLNTDKCQCSFLEQSMNIVW